jgi:hypothetical protein
VEASDTEKDTGSTEQSRMDTYEAQQVTEADDQQNKGWSVQGDEWQHGDTNKQTINERQFTTTR